MIIIPNLELLDTADEDEEKDEDTLGAREHSGVGKAAGVMRAARVCTRRMPLTTIKQNRSVVASPFLNRLGGLKSLSPST